jgi:hypothetical protein
MCVCVCICSVSRGRKDNIFYLTTTNITIKSIQFFILTCFINSQTAISYTEL